MEQSKSAPAAEAARNTSKAPAKSLLEAAIAAGNLSTFVAVLKAAGLNEEVTAQGPVTVFAPTDAAFKKLPAGAYDALLKNAKKLRAVLNYHVISGYWTTRDLKSGEVMTLQGSTLTLAASSADVQVNAARVTQADLLALNGVVHAIDAVILPKKWQLSAAA
jgi:uncharacterized surface protein with fasciclin (FAS1) repeats